MGASSLFSNNDDKSESDKAKSENTAKETI